VTEIRLDANVAKAIGQILQSQISGVPVVDALHRALADILAAADREETPRDATVHNTISAKIDAEGGIPNALINVSVRNGAVELHGVISRRRDRQMLRAIVLSVPGVRAVHDHLIWIDHISGTFLLSLEDSKAAMPAA
jgi:hypothetical protein